MARTDSNVGAPLVGAQGRHKETVSKLGILPMEPSPHPLPEGIGVNFVDGIT